MIEETRFLAIDYGKKRIGLALTDPLKIFSYPFQTINNDSSLMIQLKEIIASKNIVKIILGYPLKESGEITYLTKEVVDFGKMLEGKFDIEIVLWDERYSSTIAMDNIIESGTKKQKRRDKGLVDRNAAAVILKEYLDSTK